MLVSENNTTFAHRNTDESDTGRAGLVSGNLRYTAVTDLCRRTALPMHRSFFLFMAKKRKLRLDDDMDYFDSQYLDYQDKKRKQAEMERKAERRDNIKFWMEVVTFVIMIFTILYSYLETILGRVWRWLLSLWTE